MPRQGCGAPGPPEHSITEEPTQGWAWAGSALPNTLPPAPSVSEGAGEPTKEHMKQLLLLVGLATVLVAGGLWSWQQREINRQVVFMVPAGYAKQKAGGVAPPILPETIELVRGVRDTLIIVNQDTEAIQVGPYLVAPGQRFTQRYASRGTFDLICSIHESERMRVIVR